MATAAAHFSSNKSNFFWHQSCKWGREKITWEREIYIFFKNALFELVHKKLLSTFLTFVVPSTYIDLMQEMSRNKCHMIRPFFCQNWFFVFLVLTILTQKKSCLWCVIVHKKLVQVFLVLWHDGFWEASTEGGYETTTKSFDGSNKTEVVGGRFFEAAAAVKACENLLSVAASVVYDVRLGSKLKTSIRRYIFFMTQIFIELSFQRLRFKSTFCR